MSKQFRNAIVGAFIIVGVIVFIILYTWLSGKIGMMNSYDVKVYFSDVAGLQIGDPVMLYGLNKGKVKKMKIDHNRVVVILSMERSILLPFDSRFAICSFSYLGPDRYVKVTPGCADSIPPYYVGISETPDIESITMRLDSLLINIKDFTPDEMNKFIKEISTETKTALRNFNKAISYSSNKIDDLSAQFDTLSNLVRGSGTVGRLLTSDELYEELRQTNKALKELVEDIKANPKKYLEIKVF